MTSFRILAVDGGGIRGIIPATILATLEENTGRPIVELFDLVVGTSTGGILALGLTAPDGKGAPKNKAADLLDLYGSRAEDVFPGGGKISWTQRLSSTRDPSEWSRDPIGILNRVAQRIGAPFGGNPRFGGPGRYFSSGLETVLDQYVSNNNLVDALGDVIVTSYDLAYGNPVLFSSRPRAGYVSDVPMKVVARATSAGPTYFAPQPLPVEGRQLALVDGGVYINNPSLLALVEGSAASERAGRPIALVSLGTGTRNAASPRTLAEVNQGNWLVIARMVMEAAMTGGGELAESVLGRIVGSGDGGRYWRIQTTIGKCNFSMDDSSPENLKCLRALASQVVDEHEGELTEIADVLTAR
jgi:uncharacterized protein